ncbi:MAG: type II toxin-antitoxin system VapC family toxin [Cyanobacteria bacterium J06576_12]
MSKHSLSDFAISVVTFHEQMLGSHAYINRARSANELVTGYEIMTKIVTAFKGLPVVSFNATAAAAYSTIEPQRIQLAKMDARIAAIALSHKLVLLTRNHRDFSKVAGLIIEDWALPL